METKRRGFLGMIGGAVAAGPALASGAGPVSSAALNNKTTGDMSFQSDLSRISGLGGKDDAWLSGRIEECRRLIRGDLTEAEKLDHRRSHLERRKIAMQIRVESLRSVSDARKVDIYLREAAAIDDTIIMLGHERSLLGWLERVTA